MEITGYKSFTYPMTNRYGLLFEVGKTYQANGPIKFKTNGFHFCERMEDTLRYFDNFKYDIDTCEVIGMGNIDEYYDDYYGYYDMYSASIITIVKRLTRLETLELANKMDPIRLSRFIKRV